MAAQRQARRLVAGGRRARGLQAVGLDGVVLQQQRHLQLAARTRQALRPSGGGGGAFESVPERDAWFGARLT